MHIRVGGERHVDHMAFMDVFVVWDRGPANVCDAIADRLRTELPKLMKRLEKEVDNRFATLKEPIK